VFAFGVGAGVGSVSKFLRAIAKWCSVMIESEVRSEIKDRT
jgi:hypothetical protein